MTIAAGRICAVGLSGVMALWCTNFLISAQAAEEKWKGEMIADALLAAPPSVTDTASIYGWTVEGDLVLVRYGVGPYTCVSSGAFSLRVGKPPLPYPDPMCLDQNAWAFLQALWTGKAGNALPTAPGLVWMLAGMNVTRSAIDVGASTITMTEHTAEAGETEILQMTPHVMILPLPFDEKSAGLSTKYSADDPLNAWIMAAGKPHEHLMVHFSDQDTMALMKTGQ